MVEATVSMTGIGDVDDVRTLCNNQTKNYDAEIVEEKSNLEAVVEVTGKANLFEMDVEAIGGTVYEDLSTDR